MSTLYLANGIISSNCRTTTCPYFDDTDVKGYVEGTRAARDPKTGKTVHIPRNMSYEEWEKKYVLDK